jgi:hypothetical protein
MQSAVDARDPRQLVQAAPRLNEGIDEPDVLRVGPSRISKRPPMPPTPSGIPPETSGVGGKVNVDHLGVEHPDAPPTQLGDAGEAATDPESAAGELFENCIREVAEPDANESAVTDSTPDLPVAPSVLQQFGASDMHPGSIRVE